MKNPLGAMLRISERKTLTTISPAGHVGYASDDRTMRLPDEVKSVAKGPRGDRIEWNNDGHTEYIKYTVITVYRTYRK